MIPPGTPIIPDIDIWMRALDRGNPDPRIVTDLGRRIEDRSVILLGWVRQGILARVADERQVGHLRWTLSGFPDLRAQEPDHARAAAIVRRLRGRGTVATPWQALVWALAERVRGVVWSTDRRWQGLQPHGCPVRSAV
ncbi:MAG: hypothetical protein RLZZ127_2121 [Planctomycetota bacterium]|jgi:hypothetical protein